jgi:hypothetical protein
MAWHSHTLHISTPDTPKRSIGQSICAKIQLYLYTPNMENIVGILSDRAQFIVPTAAILIGYVIVTKLLSGTTSNFPHLGKEIGNSEARRKAYLKGAVELYRQGYAKFKDTAYRLTTVDGR